MKKKKRKNNSYTIIIFYSLEFSKQSRMTNMIESCSKLEIRKIIRFIYHRAKKNTNKNFIDGRICITCTLLFDLKQFYKSVTNNECARINYFFIYIHTFIFLNFSSFLFSSLSFSFLLSI